MTRLNVATIPTVKVGRLLRVPIRAMERKLDKVIEA